MELLFGASFGLPNKCYSNLTGSGISFGVSIVKSVATVTGISVVTRAISFLFKIYLTRTLGAEVIGLYSICLSVFFLFIALTTGGLGTVLSRKIAESEAGGDNLKPAAYLGTAMGIALAAAAIALGIGYALTPDKTFILSDERALPMLKIMLPALITTTFYIVIRGWFWGTKQFGIFSVTELLEEILRVLFTLILVSGVISGISGASGLALAFTLSDVAVALAVFAVFLKKGGSFKRGVSPKELLKPALPLTAMRVLGSAVGTILALILPNALINAGSTVSEATAAVGRISGMANPLIMVPNAIIGSLAVVLVPEMSADNARGDSSRLQSRIDSAISFAIAVSGLFMAVYSALGTELTQWLYKDVESGVYLEKAAWLMLLTPVNMIVATCMNSVGMEKESFLSFIPGTLLMLASCWFLPGYIGIDAVIVANLLSLSVEVVINLILLHKKIKLKFGFIKTLVSVACIAVLIKLFADFVCGICARLPLFAGLAISGITSCLLYAGMACAFGLADLKRLCGVFKKRRRQQPPSNSADRLKSST